MIIFKPHEVLTHIAPHLPENPIILEAGSFDGRDTIKLAKQWPQATIHAFEPVPELFEKLKANTASYPNIHCYPIALSNNTGTGTLYLAEKPNKPGAASQASSLLKPKERLELSPIVFPTTIEVPTTTIDTWMNDYHIDRLDFLWLDLQGYELNVLKAAPKALANVSVIYTEVEFVEAYEGQYQYGQVKTWLEEQGFTMIGKDFPDQPTWFFGNALFVRTA